MASRLMQVELGQTYCVKLNYRAAQNSVNKQIQRVRAAGGVLCDSTYVVTPSTPTHQCQLNWLIKSHGVEIVDSEPPSVSASLS